MLHLFFSVLIGAVLQLLAIVAFFMIARGAKSQVTSATQIRNRFYLGELVKWLVVVVGFSGIWFLGYWNPTAVLVGFFVSQLIYWRLLFLRKPEKIHLARKPAI
ncbi:MAG: hypothetical protein RLZ35_1195 [Pseudomonadota bacterium]|jgi:F0F1-type ATP synthase assembly protein I